MNFYLTKVLVCPIGHRPILRTDFEEWAVTWHPLDFPEKDVADALKMFWAGEMAGMNPEDKVGEYVRIYEKKDEWSRIQHSISAMLIGRRRF